MSNVEQKKLLSALNHDLVNIFFGVSVASETSAKYYEGLIAVYRKANADQKQGIEIPEKALQLLEKNLANIKHEMNFANFYLKSIKYNFYDFHELTCEKVDIAAALGVAKKHYHDIFNVDSVCDDINIGSVFININKEVLLNIMIRLFVLGKIYDLLSVSMIDTSTEKALIFAYQTPDMLRAHAATLDDRTLNLPEMKMPFNLSVCCNYMKSIGGEVNLLYHDSKSYLKLCFPIDEASA